MISAYERTPERPMAFTPGDLWRGAWRAWCVFMVILLVVIAAFALRDAEVWLTIVMLGYTAVIGGLIALAVMLVFVPVASLLGRALVRVRFVTVHVFVFAVLGASVGLVVVVLSIALGFDAESLFASGVAWAVIGVCAISVVAGWSHAARRARQSDRSGGVHAWWSRTPRDQDAAFEDRALDA